MSHYIFVVILLIVGVLAWLIIKHKKLSQEMKDLSETLESIKGDVAGLCSAAVSVDNRLTNSNEQLMDVVEKVIDFEKNEHHSSQPYHSAIQKVRNGANAEELIQQCGLSREEAVLLIRLHGERQD